MFPLFGVRNARCNWSSPRIR